MNALALIYWALSAGVKSKNIPVPCEFVSCPSEASALPWPFCLRGLEQKEEHGGQEERASQTHPEHWGILFSTRAAAQKGRLVKVL